MAKKSVSIGNYIGAVIVGVVVVGIIAIGFFGSRSGGESAGTIPSFVDQQTLAWTYNPDASTGSELEIWEDFQCSACQSFSANYSEMIQRLADEGVFKLVMRQASFFDDRIPGQHSARAGNSFMCAVEHTTDPLNYHRMLLSMPGGSAGWSDDAFVNIAELAGVSGDALSSFDTCVKEDRYLKWAVDSQAIFAKEQLPGTPYVTLNGTQVPQEVLSSSAAEFEQWLRDNA
jgi:hypothetical protein